MNVIRIELEYAESILNFAKFDMQLSAKIIYF